MSILTKKSIQKELQLFKVLLIIYFFYENYNIFPWNLRVSLHSQGQECHMTRMATCISELLSIKST